MTQGGDVTQLLEDWRNGDDGALERLMPLIYEELRLLAGTYLRRERSDHTLETSALVHEAYLRLVDQRRVQWRNRAHFFGIAAKMMRRVLVNHARDRLCAKRGSRSDRVPLDEVDVAAQAPWAELLDVDRALARLATADPRQAKVVELRYFGGLTSEETAEVLGISVPTVTRRWQAARAWLYRVLSGGET